MLAQVTPKSTVGTVLLLMLCSSIQATTLGYDASMMNGLNIVPAYADYFQLNTALTSLLSAISWAGSVVAGFFYGTITEIYGRKNAMAAAAAILIASAILQTASQNTAMFCASRFFIGLGTGAVYICSPAYLAETLPMKWRGFGLSIFIDFYYVGGLIAAGVTYGSFQMDSTWAWRLPSALQGLFGFLALALIPMIPESPRWLVNKGHKAEALSAIALTHANGNLEDPVVLAVYKEIIDAQEFEAEKVKELSYLEVLKSKQSLRRLALVISVAVISMVSGNNIISYYLGTMLDNAGITNTNTQLQINIYLNIWCLLCAIGGTALIERMGRKPLAIVSCLLTTVLIFAFGALSKVYGDSTDSPAVYGSVAVIFLFQGAYSFAWTPLSVAYPPEVLNYSIRSVGLGVYAFFSNGMGLMVTMAFPYALEKITWKTYMINGAWNVVQVIFVVLFWVETKGLSLEEIDEVFDGIKNHHALGNSEMSENTAGTPVLDGIEVKSSSSVITTVKEDRL